MLSLYGRTFSHPRNIRSQIFLASRLPPVTRVAHQRSGPRLLVPRVCPYYLAPLDENAHARGFSTSARHLRVP